jgi:outer membrane lipoprotein-sorting protein
MDAQRLVGDSLAAYRALSTYQDDGYVVVRSKDQSHLQRTSFETRFLRPSYFRFKFSSPHPYPPLAHVVTTCVCGFDGQSAYLCTRHYGNPARVQNYVNIAMAVAGATGISSGSAHTIAQMLLDGLPEHVFASMENAKLGDREVVEGRACQSVHGRIRQADVDITLFIDPDTMTLRQLTTRFAEFTSTEVRRNIRLNEALDKAVFARPDGAI